MRHLKLFEEAFGKRVESTQMGIAEEEVRECFYDLSDEGWVIVVKFIKVLKSKVAGTNLQMVLIPNLEIKIHKKFPKKVFPKDLADLEESQEYKGCIGLLNSRLEEHDLIISKNIIEVLGDGGSQIFILIYRKSDENYIK